MRNLTAIVLMVVAASVASAATALAVAPKEAKKELILEAPLSVTNAAADEDRCLAKAYEELRQNRFSIDEAKVAAVDMCVKDNFGRLGYAQAMAASMGDPAYTDAATNELIKQVKEFSSAAMARISENLESNR